VRFLHGAANLPRDIQATQEVAAVPLGHHGHDPQPWIASHQATIRGLAFGPMVATTPRYLQGINALQRVRVAGIHEREE
jgi:hypothetical protein